MIRRVLRDLTIIGAAGATVAAAHSIVNCFFLRDVPMIDADPSQRASIGDTISVLLPARNEADKIGRCVRSVLAQEELTEFLVLDDGSTDGTSDVIRSFGRDDPRARLINSSSPPPPGWLGKAWACQRLADQATGSVLVFIDADVELHPDAVGTTVEALRSFELDLVSPYPMQLADTLVPRLIQPLLEWSWLSFTPLRISERTQAPSMAVANGQFLAVDAQAYRAVGGHYAVANEVIEDVCLARAFRRRGYRTAVVNGSDIAVCRMYRDQQDLVPGYAKSLWKAFGNEYGAIAVVAALGVMYVLPPVAAVAGLSRSTRLAGLGGYAAAVLGRTAVAWRTGQPVMPDVLSHPISIVAMATITGYSIVGKRKGTLNWKGRSIIT